MYELLHGDCLSVMKTLPTGHASLTITSPPYEDARTYGIDFKCRGQAWVDWVAERVVEMCRVTDGLVVFNASGKVKHFRYSPVMEWLVADLTRNHGIVCGPAPYVYHRSGIPGSGGPHYHRRDWEPVYCFARPECLPPKFSDNTVMGHPPKWAPGGAMSNRKADGQRVNEGTASAGRRVTRGRTNGDTQNTDSYHPPAKANPGNVIKCKVGGNLMGDKLAHESEAPFPESLVEFFVLSYAPPGGLVLDPFCGSGTVVKVALTYGRNAIGIDVRDGKGGLDTTRRRLELVTPLGLYAAAEGRP